MKESIIHTCKEKRGWQRHRQASQAPSHGLKQLQQLPTFTMLAVLSLQVLHFCDDSFWINCVLQMAPQVATGRSEKRWSGDCIGHKQIYFVPYTCHSTQYPHTALCHKPNEKELQHRYTYITVLLLTNQLRPHVYRTCVMSI